MGNVLNVRMLCSAILVCEISRLQYGQDFGAKDGPAGTIRWLLTRGSLAARRGAQQLAVGLVAFVGI